MVELIDVRGRKVECLIECNGEKTVGIIPGMGCSIYDWMDIAYEVVCYANRCFSELQQRLKSFIGSKIIKIDIKRK